MTCYKSEFTHKHHIIPRYMGGSNKASNLVEVTVTQHAMFHFCNYQLWGNEEDRLAWLGLSGILPKEEYVYQLILLGQKKAIVAAKSPQAREKQKQSLKKIGHQRGEKNSQYGTMWINNPQTRENIRISKEDPIPEGWFKGRVIDFDGKIKKEQKRELKKLETLKRREKERNEKVKFYTEWYEIYKETDFKTFCKITGYSKSHQNLCHKFKDFVDSYESKVKPKPKPNHELPIPTSTLLPPTRNNNHNNKIIPTDLIKRQ